MGLAASQARFLSLTARKSDLEFNGQKINQERMRLSYQTSTLFSDIISLTDPAEYELKELQIEDYHRQDRILEMELKNIDTQQKEVQTEIDAVKKVIDKNVEMTFKTFA